MLRSNIDGLKNCSGGNAGYDDNAKTVVKLLCGADVFLCLRNSDAVDEVCMLIVIYCIKKHATILSHPVFGYASLVAQYSY